MRVSVVIAAYNVRKLVARAIDSVRAQTMGDWEIIVVDDASQDGTAAVVADLARGDGRIRLISLEPNHGPASARNRGIAEAAGEWIAVLDADDAWEPRRLERMLAIGEARGAELVADNLILYDDHAGRESGRAFEFAAPVVDFTPLAMFSHTNPWQFGILKPLMRRALLKRTGLCYDERLRFGEDFLLLAELLFNGAHAVATQDAWYIYSTPVGHISRQRSTGTRSKTSLESLMWITDALSERYAAAIGPEIRRGIVRCRRRTKRRWIAREITRLRESRSLPDLIAFLAGHPNGALRYFLTSSTLKRAFGRIPLAN